MAFVGSLLPWLDRQIHDLNGAPGAGWTIESFVAGENPPTTHKALYADALLTTPLANPATFDTDGRLTAFMTYGAYDFLLYDADDVFQFSILGVEDYGSTFLRSMGTQAWAGSKSVATGYVVLSTDMFVTCNSTGTVSPPFILNLSTAANHPQFLCVKNAGTVAVEIRPAGSETLELGGAGVAYTIPASAAPNYTTVVLFNDGISAWAVYSSHGL